ncbi:hypothetical protein JYP46_01295 [Nitratireductor aquimarinus]|uniref:hypothetical protein n=1 Tax=Alphaproteobacteria TaxID=28211 RepID=UPI0019D40343|nr:MULTISPECIES: hypothetical protein [Alphaproteobacteria]MBN7755445.1 hypothetical protein [Nitratireductor aquimarinus]MBY5998200.1 hypothetical protein [Tritonibacter mobilis]MBY6020227.1 hypothetical protein [Nitratireductor sp. DP7N14-4]
MNREQIDALEWAISELYELGIMRSEVRYMDALCRLRDAALSAPKAEAEEPCPVCAKPFAPGDTCATDIELGKCHAECLAGSPTVDLETGEPMDGPIGTFPHVAPRADAVTVKPLVWDAPMEGSYRATAIGLRYYVYLNSDDGLWHMYSEGYQPVNGEFATSEEAKAAAQSDYAARILSAIATSPAPKAEAETLPCDVQLPGVLLRKGVSMDTLMFALKRREGRPEEDTRFHTSPVPALTDEAVERALQALCAMDIGDPLRASKPVLETAMRRALLAAFPSKGEGE